MFEAYKEQVDEDITTKTEADSIEPVIVGQAFKDLADLVSPYLGSINNEGYSQGNDAPNNADGNDLDEYAQTQSPLIIWRKINGVWAIKWTIPLGFTFSDGPILGLRASLSDPTVTVTLGQWSVNGVLYSKATQTGFTISTADNTEETQDLIYASNGNDQVLFIAGTPGLGQPALPANSILLDVVIIPSVASGASPYLLFGNTLTSENGGSGADNPTTDPLTIEQLDIAYPGAPSRFEVICENIDLIYKKTATSWRIINMGSI